MDTRHPPSSPPSSAAAASPHYVIFDLLRGLAALTVLVFHMSYMLGPSAPAVPKGYLAVDFFFILSGFVIAANYHPDVRPAIGWRDFLVARLARLWPLLVAATLLGAVVIIAKYTRDLGYFDAAGTLRSLGANLLMLPSFFAPYGVDRLFLFNGASWSVFFEVLVNLLFFAALRGLPLRALLALSAVFAGLLIFFARANGSLDGGWSAATFHVGSLRVLFGFTAGMAIFLISRRLSVRLGGWVTAALVVAFCLSFMVDGDWRVDCALVIAGFPAIVLLGAQCEQRGWAGAPERCGRFLGDVSYSVYLLQTPAMLFTAGACEWLTGRKIAEFAPFSGVLFIAALFGVSYLSWRYFELPARNLLRRRLAARPRPSYAVREEVA
ncbi:MAG: acyltransferase [Propionivibrio sp.]